MIWLREYKIVKPLSKTVCLKILITELIYDPGILLLGFYLRKIKTVVHKLVLKCLFTEILFIVP